VAATVFLFTLVLSGFFDAMGTITASRTRPGCRRTARFPDGPDPDGGRRGRDRGRRHRLVAEHGVPRIRGGVGEGARNRAGQASSPACCCAATLLFTPLAGVVPAQAAAPALVVIGGMMVAQCRHIPWHDPDYTIPVFLTAALIPFTYSITNGVGAGLIASS